MGDVIPFPGPQRVTTHSSTQPKMYCAGCGIDRTVRPADAIPGPCPKCGSTNRTSHPNEVVVAGKGVSVTVTMPLSVAAPFPTIVFPSHLDGPR